MRPRRRRGARRPSHSVHSRRVRWEVPVFEFAMCVMAIEFAMCVMVMMGVQVGSVAVLMCEGARERRACAVG